MDSNRGGSGGGRGRGGGGGDRQGSAGRGTGQGPDRPQSAGTGDRGGFGGGRGGSGGGGGGRGRGSDGGAGRGRGGDPQQRPPSAAAEEFPAMGAGRGGPPRPAWGVQQQAPQQQQPVAVSVAGPAQPLQPPFPAAVQQSTATAASAAAEQLPFEFDQQLVIRDRVRPKRPSVGTAGRPIKLLVNMYGITFPGSDCYHYDVVIKPETLPPINRRVIAAWQDAHMAAGGGEITRLAVYDGRKNLYTPRPLGLENEREGVTYQVSIDSKDGEELANKKKGGKGDDAGQKREQSFTVIVRQVAIVNMERLSRFLSNTGEAEAPHDAIQVLDVLLKSRPTMLFNSINRSTGGSFYHKDGGSAQVAISGGLSAHQGWKQSIRPTYKSLLLNLDVATSCFYQAGPLVNVVAGFFNKRSIDDLLGDARLCSKVFNPQSPDFQKLSKFLSKVNVDITHRDSGRRKYKIQWLHKLDSRGTQITVDGEAKKLTVEKYFDKYLNKKLRYPMLPLVAAGQNGQLYFPMEFCVVRTGQRHIGKLNEMQTADVIKVTAVPPQERRAKIDEGRSTIHSESSHVDLISQWGLKIDTRMKEIDARVLPPPQVLLSNPKGPAAVHPKNGVFDLSKMREGFFRPAELRCVGIAVFGYVRSRPEEINGFMLSLLKDCRARGMRVAEYQMNDLVTYQERMGVEQTLSAANQYAVEAARANGINASKAQIIFCIFDKGGPLYDEIKCYAETKLGLMTQCFLAKHIFNTKPGVLSNLALKVNAKLGGVNFCVDPKTMGGPKGLSDGVTMIMGADVTHPPPGADQGVSIAAVVGSVDSKFCEYRAAIRVQPPRCEIIAGLGEISRELLQQFKQRANGRTPTRILFFRDGVSEGQFGEVALREVQDLKKSFKEMGLGDVKLTFLVINKRHGTRLFPTKPNDGDRKGNVLEGTVVDTGITHPFEFDFYLNSHPGLQGTSRSSHYHVLYDENQFSADSLQELTYRMCYVYARATRAVSIVPPVYYAHHVAARARSHRIGSLSDTASGTGSSGIGSARQEDFAAVLDEIRQTMYFT